MLNTFLHFTGCILGINKCSIGATWATWKEPRTGNRLVTLEIICTTFSLKWSYKKGHVIRIFFYIYAYLY